MLAQSFKSADELGITELQHEALRKVLVLLETGKLKFFPLDGLPLDLVGIDRCFSGYFNMGTFGANHKCGTVACIAGTAELITAAKFIGCIDRPEALSELFYARSLDRSGRTDPLDTITPSQAATALRSYLTTGNARWDLAVA